MSDLGMKIENFLAMVGIDYREAERLFQHGNQVTGFRQRTKDTGVGTGVDAGPRHEHQTGSRLDVLAFGILLSRDEFIPAKSVGKPHPFLRAQRRSSSRRRDERTRIAEGKNKKKGKDKQRNCN